jgi:ferrous iron transport protein B
MTAVAALAFLMLNLFSPPCFAAIGAMNSEIKDRKWFWSGIALQFTVGYSIGFFTYFFGTLFTGADFSPLWTTVTGWCVIAAIATVVTGLIIKKNRELKAESSVKAG